LTGLSPRQSIDPIAIAIVFSSMRAVAILSKRASDRLLIEEGDADYLIKGAIENPPPNSGIKK
jgi:hypothetical protein